MKHTLRTHSLRALVVVCSAIPVNARAADPGVFHVGFGALSHGLNRVAKDPGGNTSALGTTYYNLDFQVQIPYSTETMISPRITWMPDFLFPTSTPGSSVKTSFLMIGVPVTYNYSSAIDLSAGPTLVSYQIKGPGGTTSLSNGNSTSVFALPGNTETPRTIGILLGASYNSMPYRFAIDSLVEGIASNQKRTLSVMLTVSYAIYQY